VNKKVCIITMPGTSQGRGTSQERGLCTHGTVVFAKTMDFIVVVDFRNGQWTSCLHGGLRRDGGLQRHDGEEKFWSGGTVICDCKVFSEISLFGSFFNFTRKMLVDGRWKMVI